MDAYNFGKVGNRGSYSFNLEFGNGVVNNCSNVSAVARDIARVLHSSIEVRKIISKGYFKLI